MTEPKLTHLDESGAARMVDIGDKPITRRTAHAVARCHMREATADAVRDSTSKKGDVLQVARIAGINAAKKTDDLIPLCHSIAIDSVSVDFRWLEPTRLQIDVRSVTSGRTGVEMEAMVGASVAALTVYDMCKAIDRSMRIESVELLSKTGGTRGDYTKEGEPEGPNDAES